MKEMLVILLSAVLVDNVVLSKTYGICPFLGVSKKINNALGMGLAVIFVMVGATVLTYPIFTFLLIPLELEYLKTIAFILIIALFVQIVEIVLKKVMPPLYKALGVFLPLITTNCAVLGVTIDNANNTYSFSNSFVNSLGAGIGFTVALLMFSGVRTRLEHSDIPAAFKGVPATLIAASIVSVSFMGFSGMIENMFGA
ncbi:MAG: RnfABCDGE type electron transport complex subunit A [Oscillospiraceae bacterium]|jgi:electron transport complex protein RnfA